ncbi:CLUMA_CG013437, isoform A [Clunio marinus]|uniref:CLUMA_CG013437, isoform A n=1 Tax=Clunio marinus TaxID=568069 RepID=A0A1J1INV3_9DIPT|nr:CLUMA_CG013437, isoform A [Clunio marinus]
MFLEVSFNAQASRFSTKSYGTASLERTRMFQDYQSLKQSQIATELVTGESYSKNRGLKTFHFELSLCEF